MKIKCLYSCIRNWTTKKKYSRDGASLDLTEVYLSSLVSKYAPDVVLALSEQGFPILFIETSTAGSTLFAASASIALECTMAKQSPDQQYSSVVANALMLLCPHGHHVYSEFMVTKC